MKLSRTAQRSISTRSLFPVPVIALVLVALIDSTFLLTDSQWKGEWTAAVEWGNGGLFVAGPVASGVFAYIMYSRFSPSAWRMGGLNRHKPYVRAFKSTFINYFCALIASHWIVIIGAAMVSAQYGPTDRLKLTPIFLILFPCAVYVMVAQVSAVLIPKRIYAAVVAFAVSAVIGYAGLFGWIPSILANGGHRGTVVGFDYDPVPTTVTIIGSIFVVGVLWAVVRNARRGHLRRKRVLAIASGAIIVAIVAQQFIGTRDRFLLGAEKVASVCSDTEPQVCVLRGHEHNLSEVAEKFVAALDPLKRIGAKIPSRYSEVVPFAEQNADGGTLLLNANQLNVFPIPAVSYAQAISRPSFCAAYYEKRPPYQLLAVSALVNEWTSVKLKLSKSDSSSLASYAATVPDAAIVEAYSDLSACSISAETYEVAKLFDSSNYGR